MSKIFPRFSLVSFIFLAANLVLLALPPGEAKAAPAFVKVSGDRLTLNGQPITLKGSSFYPHDGPWQYMWTQWNGNATYQDLARGSELGNNTARILVPYGATFSWNDDNTGEIAADYLNQLKQMVQIAGNLNQRVILTLFDFYGSYPAAGSHDEQSNLNYLRAIVSAFRDDDRVIAWDLHNEPDNYGDWHDKNDPVAAIDWLARMAKAIRALDPNHLLTTGPGRFESFWQSDNAGNTLVSLSDFISIHSYNARDLNNIVGRVREISQGKPLVLEEVGWPSGPIFNTSFTEQSQVDNYKFITEAAKNQQVSGLIQWELWDMLPYGIYNYETYQNYYGLVRRNGTLKPAAEVWKNNYKGSDLSAPSVSTNLAYTTQPIDSTPRPQYFPQTDHYVATPLKEFWRRAGGWEVFGYPLTDAFSSDDGKTVIQYFEKGRFEYHPERLHDENIKKYSNIYKYLYLIDRGFLGTEQTAGRNFPPGKRLGEDGPLYRWFEKTQHGLAEPFYNFWQNHMGEDLFGPPISEPFEETNPEDGGTRLVQYFGRVRLEFHPELAGTAYAVTVANLGTEQARARGWLSEATPGYTDPAPQSNVPPSSIVNQSSSFADTAFERTWEKTDRPVIEGKAGRTWLWGEKPFEAAKEPYAEAGGGQRLVQYFDKSRMELTNPGGDPNSKWYVTNGLLVKEMVSGQVQLGDNQYAALAPANVPLAGDPAEANPDAPTYASLHNLVNSRAPNQSGQPVNASLTKDGSVGQVSGNLAGLVKVGNYQDATGHNIADVFWNFMNNTRGPLYQNGQIVNGDVVDWLFSVGLPISEPYWTRSKVGGVEKDVLVQAFERRMLTYTPSNSAAFQIEMGNVGRHYYQWRYGNATPTVQGLDPATLNLPGGLVWRREVQGGSGALSSLMYAPQASAANIAGALSGSATAPSTPSMNSGLLYASPDEAGRFAIRRNDLKGGDSALGYGLAPALSADGSKLAYSSFSGRWLLDLNLLDVQTGATQKVQSGVGLANAFSPDGQTLAFVSFANKQTSVAVRGPGGDVHYLKSYGADGQAIANLVWSPQGRFLAYTLLKLGGRDGGIVVMGSEVHVLDTVSGADIKIADEAARPSFAPDGKKLAFVAWGKNGLFVADWNNGAATNVQAIGTARGCRDECANTGTPAFSPDGHWLAVTAPSGGLSGVRLSDGASATLTGPANAYDRDPVWVK